MVSWLLGAGLGPAAVAVPVNLTANALAGAAQRWFKRLRRTDDLSRLVRVELTVKSAIRAGIPVGSFTQECVPDSGPSASATPVRWQCGRW